MIQEAPRRRKQPAAGLACSVVGCCRPVLARGWCTKHYSRWQRHGDPHKAQFEVQRGRRAKWHLSDQGYVWRYVGRDKPGASTNGFIYQHREVMAQQLGRPLESWETVHHKNGDRADNRPENLELWVTPQPAGQRVEDLVAWAKQILALYDKP